MTHQERTNAACRAFAQWQATGDAGHAAVMAWLASLVAERSRVLEEASESVDVYRLQGEVRMLRYVTDYASRARAVLEAGVGE